jgi:hypothetical protein
MALMAAPRSTLPRRETSAASRQTTMPSVFGGAFVRSSAHERNGRGVGADAVACNAKGGVGGAEEGSGGQVNNGAAGYREALGKAGGPLRSLTPVLGPCL